MNKYTIDVHHFWFIIHILGAPLQQNGPENQVSYQQELGKHGSFDKSIPHWNEPNMDSQGTDTVTKLPAYQEDSNPKEVAKEDETNYQTDKVGIQFRSSTFLQNILSLININEKYKN